MVFKPAALMPHGPLAAVFRYEGLQCPAAAGWHTRGLMFASRPRSPPTAPTSHRPEHWLKAAHSHRRHLGPTGAHAAHRSGADTCVKGSNAAVRSAESASGSTNGASCSPVVARRRIVPSLSRADDRTPAGSSAMNRVAAEPIGRLGFGLLRNGRPETLTTWRITARDPEVVARLAALFRGMPGKSTDADEYEWHVVTETATVAVILSGPHALHVCWRRDGFGRRCGGSEQGRGARCTCGSLRSLAERKAAARRGHGCVPNIEMSFQLVDDPTLGGVQVRQRQLVVR